MKCLLKVRGVQLSEGVSVWEITSSGCVSEMYQGVFVKSRAVSVSECV